MEKAKIIVELEKKDIASAMFLMNESLTEEQWTKVSAKQITLNWDDIDDDQKMQMKIAFAMIAIGSVLKD